MEALETLLEGYGLAAIFGVMLLKSIGVPIPIPADAIMLAASARVASGRMELAGAFVGILIALVVGGTIQFTLTRGVGRNLLYRYGRFLGLTEKRLDAAANRLRKAGAVGIAVAIFTPGARSVAIPASGIAAVSLATFVTGLVLGSAAFLALHFALGYAGGTLLSLLPAGVSPVAVIGGIIVVLALGFGVWVLIRRRQMRGASTREVIASAAGAWHEATCPACLALGAASRLQLIPAEAAHAHVHHHA